MAGRLLVFAFGIATYLLSGIVVVWAVAFAGDIGGLKSVDSPPVPLPRMEAAAIDVALMFLFGLQHSVMARASFKAAIARAVPPAAERSVYVLASSLALAVLFLLWQPIPIAVWNFNGGWQRFALVALFWIGWGMVLASTFLISHFDLFGVRQVTLHARGVPYTPVAFKESWIYRRVRHPLMTSFLIAFWATPLMTVGHALLALGMTAYILVGIRFEEKDLARQFGAKYDEYRRRVPMLWPRRTRN